VGSVLWLKHPRYSQSLERGLSILGCFTPERTELGIAEIAGELGLSRPTTHRYARTLVALGFLERTPERRYRLGLRVSDLGMAALNCTGLREHSSEYLTELRQHTGFTASLAVLDGPEILYVDQARNWRQGQHRINLNVRVGSRLPAYCTAMGKVLLAYVSEFDRREILRVTELLGRGPNTILTRRALSAELENVRNVGWAVSDEELAAGVVWIAVPVRNAHGDVVAAIDMVAHRDMVSLDELVGRLVSRLLLIAEQFSMRLGYRREDRAA
jgi:IclR family pca regulon transcriptional regulator